MDSFEKLYSNKMKFNIDIIIEHFFLNNVT